MRKCPWCDFDEMDQYKALAREVQQRSPESVNHVLTLCDNCGEPMVYEATGWRKPTDAEFGRFGMTEEFKAARLIWTKAKAAGKANNMPVRKAWRHYLAATGDGNEVDPVNFVRIAAIWYSGFKQCFETIEEFLNDKDDADGAAFYTMMQLIGLELKAMAEMISEKAKKHDPATWEKSVPGKHGPN